jgi:hypothetical protein
MKNTSPKKLTLHKETLKALAVKSSIRAGISGNHPTCQGTGTRLTCDRIRTCTAACD